MYVCAAGNFCHRPCRATQFVIFCTWVYYRNMLKQFLLVNLNVLHWMKAFRRFVSSITTRLFVSIKRAGLSCVRPLSPPLLGRDQSCGTINPEALASRSYNQTAQLHATYCRCPIPSCTIRIRTKLRHQQLEISATAKRAINSRGDFCFRRKIIINTVSF
jgi:hypothetical protein